MYLPLRLSIIISAIDGHGVHITSSDVLLLYQRNSITQRKRKSLDNGDSNLNRGIGAYFLQEGTNSDLVMDAMRLTGQGRSQRTTVATV